ncbi:MAG: SUMF1/EgtB/PvdO family nonheme iron enzyme [Nannocystaceae bacterium]|nr:SUMF1/EgtB/PvdO family nonheme iron enzyme [Nannocystaceae bacterium]
METQPYKPQSARSPSSPTLGEPLPMGWADGTTMRPDGSVPAPPAFGTVLPAPPAPGARGGALRGAALGAIAGGVVLVGVIAWWNLRGADTRATASAPANAPAVVSSDTVGVGPSEGAAKPATPDAVAPAATPRCPAGMQFIAGGKFYMGTDADDPVLAAARPAHPVEVPPFCIDIHEVTVDGYRACSTKGECKRAFRESRWPQGNTDQTQWRAQMDAHSELCNESRDDRGTHPINCVDWAQAQHFCQWRGATLPTEAQWEFAARGSDGRVYSWGDAKPSRTHMNGAGPEYVAWRQDKGLPPHAVLYDEADPWIGTAPVGSATEGASQQGLFDLAGNVFEWTADAYAPYPGADAPASSDTSDRRVIRGGAFNSFQPQFADPALRFPQAADAHTHGIGFRCAAAPQ